MSLILATRFKGGILLAADPFYFDNDGEVPLKGINFDKFVVSELHKCAIVGVGSVWVLQEAGKWIASQQYSEDLLNSLASKWKELNHEWKENREQEIAQFKYQTLRPLSESLFIMAKSDDLSKIFICDSEGRLHSTLTFVISGSGCDLVRQFLESEKKRFLPTDSLERCLELAYECYHVAKYDLYVIGFPSIVLVTAKGIRNLSKRCQAAWDKTEKDYFIDLKSIALKANQAID